MENNVFSEYKINRHADRTTVRIMPNYSYLEKFGLYGIVGLCILIPSWIIYHTAHIPQYLWFPWLAISLFLVFFSVYKYNWKLWGWNLFTFDRKGFFLSSNAGPMHLQYAEIKTVEIFKESTSELYGLHIIMQKDEVIAIHFLCTSQKKMEELAQMIITQVLSKELIEKPVKATYVSKLYDRFFTNRLNRKNFLIGIIIAWLLFVDLVLIGIVIGETKFRDNRVYFAYVFAMVVWCIFFLSLVSRRKHDIGYAVNELYEKQNNDVPLYWVSPAGRFSALVWLSVQLATMESAQYENQYGKPPLPTLSLRNVFGL